MTQTCYSAGCVESGRVALVDSCTGEFITDPNSQYTFGGITSITWEPQIEDGETTTVKDMCGNICVRDLQCDQTVGYNVEITLCRPDNELVGLVTGEPVLLDIDGNTIGYFQLDDSNCAPFVSLELFEKLPESACTDGVKYRRIIFPKIRLTQATPERQGPIRLLKLSGTSESGLGDGWASGPNADSPVDFSTLMTAGQKFHMAEVYDTAAPTPQCGFPAPIPPQLYTINASPFSCEDIIIQGPDLVTTLGQITLHNQAETLIVDYYNPFGPNDGLNPPGSTQVWTATDIFITDPQWGGEDIFYMYLRGQGGTPPTMTPDLGAWPYDQEGGTLEIADCPDPLPLFTLVEQDGAGGEIVITGTDLDFVQDATWNSGWIPGFLFTLQTPTEIRIALADMAPRPFTLTHFNPSVGNNLSGTGAWDGSINVVDAGPAPIILTVNSPVYDNFNIEGTDLDLLGEIQVINSGATFSDYYYDPAGPNAGDNPGTATIFEWSESVIDITDSQWGGDTIDAIQMNGTVGVTPGLTPSYGTVSGLGIAVPDYAGEDYADVALSYNPTSYWKFDDADTTAIDSISGFDLTEVGTLTFLAGDIRTGGESITGWSVTDYLQRNTPVGTNPTDPFTLEMVLDIGPSLPAGIAGVISYDGPEIGGDGFYMTVDPAGVVTFGIGAASASWSTPLATNNPTVLAVVVDGGNFQLYRGGAPDSAVTPFTGYAPDPGATLYVGMLANLGAPFTAAGRISDLAVYPTALTTGQLFTHYEQS